MSQQTPDWRRGSIVNLGVLALQPEILVRARGGVTMNTGPTAEVHARKVLAILKERNVSAGGYQMLKLIEQAFMESGGGLDDCIAGVECGVEKGWFDLSGVELKLTEAGAGHAASIPAARIRYCRPTPALGRLTAYARPGRESHPG